MSYSTTTKVNSTGGDKASIIFDVTNFHAAVATVMKGCGIESKPCNIRRSEFIIQVYPSSAEGKVSVFLMNKSLHKVVIVYSIKVGNKTMSSGEEHFKESAEWGWNFMDRKEVGPNLHIVANVTLLKEEGVVGKDDFKDTVKEMEAMTIKQTNKIKSEIKNELKQEFNKGLSDMKKRFEESETKMVRSFQESEAKMKRGFEESEAKMNVNMGKMENMLKARDPIKIPECPICFEELRPPLRIVQCLKGHKICELCSEREAVVSCPTNCKSDFMGRDHGMEAFVKQLLGEHE